MEALPDYPERVAADHALRVERATLLGSLALIAIGAWWLLGSIGSQSSPSIRFAPVALLFSGSLLLSDLTKFDPSGKFRIATSCCISWPPLLAITEVNRVANGNLGALVLLGLMTLFLLISSRKILSHSISSRRWRGIATLLGLGIAAAIVLDSAEPISWAIVIAPTISIIVPDFLIRDQSSDQRRKFSEELRRAEREMLRTQSETPGMQQPASILKIAREEGWADPEKGLRLILEAEQEAHRIEMMSRDIQNLKIVANQSVSRSESITGRSGKSREILELAEKEFEQGSFREAETLLRSARSKSDSIERYWSDAKNAIQTASEAIGSETGHMIDSIRKSLDAAMAAMDDDDPMEALTIASTIPDQVSGADANIEIANESIREAKRAISTIENQPSVGISRRMDDAIDALKKGDASMARGLADGIIREVKQTSDASSTVQRSLRQRGSIEGRLPSGDSRSEWTKRLDSITKLANEGDWIVASEKLSNFVRDLEKFESERLEAQEMLDFLNSDWPSLRSRLDSAGIQPNNPNRMKTEKSLAEAEEEIENGNLKAALHHMGSADESMEALRRMA